MSDANPRLFKFLRMYCEATAIAVVVLGCLILSGWAFHIELLKSVLPGLLVLKVNTALGLAFSGTSLWLLLPGESRTRRGYIARFLALLVALIGAATVSEYLFGLNLRIDQLLFNEPVGAAATFSPGRMAPTTATAFLAIGLALLLLDWKTRRGRRPAQVLSLWAALIAMMAISGYLYHATALYRIWLYTQVAIPTAIALSLLSVAVFFARPRTGIAGDLTGEGSGSVMARRLLPAVFTIPILLGWIRWQGQLAGMYGTELGLALFATSNVVVFAVLVWSNARKMNVECSQRRRAEAEIRELNAEAKYRGLLEAAPDAMVVVNQGGEIVLLNLQAERQFGYPRDELLGQNIKNIIPEGFAERLLTRGSGSLDDPNVQQMETGIELYGRRKDASHFPIEIMLSPLKSPEGILVTAAIRDITRRKKAEEHLAQMEGKYRGLLEAAPDTIVVVNQGGEIVLLNLQAEKQFGYHRDELVGQKVKNIIPEGFAERLTADGFRSVEEALAQQMGTGLELQGRRKDASDFPIEIMLSPLESPEGILVTAAIRDITARKKAEQHLLQKLEELNRSNEELVQFASIASHDLQEPLRMVASYTQLLAKRYKGRLDSDADEFLSHAVAGANHMQRLIADLLTYSRVGTRGKDLRDTSSEEALRQALINLRGVIEESSAVVTYDALPTVLADDVQLVQLFQNVVGNAIKYRTVGVPRVHISAAENGEKKWVFSVQDNGLGIDPQYFEKIFGMFQRLHKRETFAGTGIGLAICKKIVERHGGRIWLESQQGQGTTFHFTLSESEVNS